MRASLGVVMRASLGAVMRVSLGVVMRASLGAVMRASLEAAIRASLGAVIRTSLGAILRASLGAMIETAPLELKVILTAGQTNASVELKSAGCTVSRVDWKLDSSAVSVESKRDADTSITACGSVSFKLSSRVFVNLSGDFNFGLSIRSC